MSRVVKITAKNCQQFIVVMGLLVGVLLNIPRIKQRSSGDLCSVQFESNIQYLGVLTMPCSALLDCTHWPSVESLPQGNRDFPPLFSSLFPLLYVYPRACLQCASLSSWPRRKHSEDYRARPSCHSGENNRTSHTPSRCLASRQYAFVFGFDCLTRAVLGIWWRQSSCYCHSS